MMNLINNMVVSFSWVSAFTLILSLDCLSTKVNGTGLDSEDEPEVKYAILGAGIAFRYWNWQMTLRSERRSSLK
ncbi:transmembrane protein 273-like [Acipenser oxyrinchus oxyrinchus]|uniref:Transmembrane protein 273-like n=1 Tax=Acipenser oxyrinchus oxyrinchus TaxID=40147 RepID=A0AAD8DC62_ACIOX|nr:transmembrane protein 273-like [Acipenser oxyrinchus oxyrinchus]